MRLRTLVAMLLALPLGNSGIEPRLPLGREARIAIRPVAFAPGDPDRRRAGALTFLGGAVLTSPDSAFGGFSAMAVDGHRFTLLSDGGNIVRFRLDSKWRIHDATFGDLPGPGTGWRKAGRDSESLTVDLERDRAWVGFENSNAIWRYDASLARPSAAAVPPRMAHWPVNGGPEAMARRPNGSFVVLGEVSERAGRGSVPGVFFPSDPTESPRRGFGFRYLPAAGHNPSDLAALPDGRLLVLERGVTPFGWFTARLALIDPRSLRPGAVVQGRELARLDGTITRDNYEALGIGHENGATIVWLATDDNRAWYERTLLMKFRLDL